MNEIYTLFYYSFMDNSFNTNLIENNNIHIISHWINLKKNKQNSKTVSKLFTLKLIQSTNSFLKDDKNLIHRARCWRINSNERNTNKFCYPKCIYAFCEKQKSLVVSSCLSLTLRQSYKLRSTRGACKWLVLPCVDDRPQISSLQTQCI